MPPSKNYKFAANLKLYSIDQKIKELKWRSIELFLAEIILMVAGLGTIVFSFGVFGMALLSVEHQYFDAYSMFMVMFGCFFVAIFGGIIFYMGCLLSEKIERLSAELKKAKREKFLLRVE